MPKQTRSTARRRSTPSAGPQPRGLDAAVRRLKEAQVEAVGLAFVDLAGVTRVKVVPAQRFDAAARSGIGLSTVFSVFLANDDITSSEGIDTATGDTRLVPDPAETVPLAAMPGWAWAPVDQLTQEGEPWGACPRTFAKRMLARLADRGLELRGAYEVEFFLGRRPEADPASGDEPDPVPAHHGPAYSATIVTETQAFLLDLMRALERQGTGVMQVHGEYSRGQVEVSIPHRAGIGIADDSVVLRQTIRAVAQSHGLAPSFSPAPFAGLVGNGHHIHFSLWNRRGRNLFVGGDGLEGMTPEAEAFSAGVLAELPAITAICCPCVPSYLRLLPHHWAGAFTAWGRENREAAMRFITGMVGGREQTANMEMKAMDAASNPYLALGAIVAAGLNGLERELRLPEPTTEYPDQVPARQAKARRIRRLPTTLAEATKELEASDVLRDAFGKLLFDAVLAVRRREWETYGAEDDDVAARAHRWRY